MGSPFLSAAVFIHMYEYVPFLYHCISAPLGSVIAYLSIPLLPAHFRYTAMHGKFVIHPVDGRRIPIICDAELVDMSFGTGAVKVPLPE